MSVFLSAADLYRITGRVRYGAQRAKLDQLGIRYRKAANGEPLVREADLDTSSRRARNGPRWELIAS